MATGMGSAASPIPENSGGFQPINNRKISAVQLGG